MMNNCKRIFFSDRRTGLNFIKTHTNVRLCPHGSLASRQFEATGTRHASDAGTEDKPRLRAIDLARKIQQQRTQTRAQAPPVSAQQKRAIELKQFSQQLQNVHPNVLAKHLRKTVVYQDKDVVVVNKPYAVPVRDDSGATSISSVLPIVSKLMEERKVISGSQLLPTLSLEKETTGALLLARSEDVLEKILDQHRNNQIERKYWVITVGVPVPSEGLIDIPIIEKEVTGPQPHFKMALSPYFRMNNVGDGVIKVRGHRQAQSAMTKYKVLDSSCGCSLIELQSFPGVKHQMRVHLAFALSCPILGDHKYSHWNKLAPQKLPEQVLGKLRLEQSKVRHLPLHLHARQLTLPGTGQNDIHVSCPLPKYFIQTLNQLHLKFPDEKE